MCIQLCVSVNAHAAHRYHRDTTHTRTCILAHTLYIHHIYADIAHTYCTQITKNSLSDLQKSRAVNFIRN